MDLMTLAAKLTLDDGDFRRGVGDAEASGRSLANKLSSMSVAVGQIVADMAKKAISEINGLIRGTIGGFADYQQLIGGVETLFKTSSDKVVGYAKQAFRTAGISANEYMEMVTSFSASLLQGLGGDTEAAAELANMALIDMADNAAKMGTDISAIQAAYQGFARQNFTMLDNLKLGYGGTASEMIRLVNDSHILDHEIESLDEITFAQLIEAIHAIQEEMGLTGTRAKEAADTISGSEGSLTAAWKDLLAAVGGAGDETDLNTALENFKANFGTYMENLIPTLLESTGNSGTLVQAIADSIASLPKDLLSKVHTNALEAGADMVDSLSALTGWVIDSLVQMFKDVQADPSSVEKFGNAVGEFLGTAISQIAQNAPALVEGAIALGVSLAGSMIEGLFRGLFGGGDEVADMINDANRELSDNLFDIEASSTKATGILNYMQELLNKYGSAATGTDEWKRAQKELNEILVGSEETFESYGDNVQGAIDVLDRMIDKTRELAIQEAMRKATQTKMEAVILAEQELTDAQVGIQLRRKESDVARQNMLDLIHRTEAGAGYTGKDAQGNWLLIEDIAFVARSARSELEQMGESVPSTEAIDSWETTIRTSEEEISKLEGSIGQLEERVRTTRLEYETSAEATRQLTMELLGMTTAVQSVTQSFKTPGVATGGRTSQFFERSGPSYMIDYMPRAVGIEYSPAGLRTELHQGEAILTREENAARLQGTDYGEMEQMLEDAIERSMARMQISMDGQRVADLTTRRMASNISSADHARVRAMGG